MTERLRNSRIAALSSRTSGDSATTRTASSIAALGVATRRALGRCRRATEAAPTHAPPRPIGPPHAQSKVSLSSQCQRPPDPRPTLSTAAPEHYAPTGGLVT